MAKKKEGWQRGLGPYSGDGSDLNIKEAPTARGNEKPRELWRQIDEAADVNGGAPGPIPQGRW